MAKSKSKKRVDEALQILTALGLPRAQLNDRSALCLLALLDLRPVRAWAEAANPLIGVTPVMEWIAAHYGVKYAPNTRETIRRQSLHQFEDAGICRYNPDNPGRAVNSPHAVYQASEALVTLVRQFGTRSWDQALRAHLEIQPKLSEKYERSREQNLVPLNLPGGNEIKLSPGPHSSLIKAVIEDFSPRFLPKADLVYVGDTGAKWGYFARDLLRDLGVIIEQHGKMPDVVVHCARRQWLVLVEAVTSHGPVDPKRHHELVDLFSSSTSGLVFVTAFPDRQTMAKYLPEIAWETEVWVAASPSHLIHFNGERFLGPYSPR